MGNVLAILILGGLVLAVIALPLVAITARHRMNLSVRILFSVISLPPAAFALFGFMASFEPGVSVGWKIGYAAAVVLLAGSVIALWFPRSQ